MRRGRLVGALVALAGCAAAHPVTNRDGARLVVAYGGDGRGTVAPCG